MYVSSRSAFSCPVPSLIQSSSILAATAQHYYYYILFFFSHHTYLLLFLRFLPTFFIFNFHAPAFGNTSNDPRCFSRSLLLVGGMILQISCASHALAPFVLHFECATIKQACAPIPRRRDHPPEEPEGDLSPHHGIAWVECDGADQRCCEILPIRPEVSRCFGGDQRICSSSGCFPTGFGSFR